MGRMPIHGHTGRMRGIAWESPTYRSWHAMKNRCFNPRDKDHWNSYGGRKIKIYIGWILSFEYFLADMGERPGLEYSIDRIDHDGDYEPGNCRWATRSEQQRNKRISWDPSQVVDLRKQGLTQVQVAERIGVKRPTIQSWFRRRRIGF